MLGHLIYAGVTCKSKRKSLGHVLDKNGISADPENTSAGKRMPAPENVAELRSFLGMVNQLARFLPNIAEETKLLIHLLHRNAGWYWGHMQVDAFMHVKADHCWTPFLTFWDTQAVLTFFRGRFLLRTRSSSSSKRP